MITDPIPSFHISAQLTLLHLASALLRATVALTSATTPYPRTTVTMAEVRILVNVVAGKYLQLLQFEV